MIGLSAEFRENTYTLTLKNYSTKKCYQKCFSQIKEEFHYETKCHDLDKKKRKKITIERRNNLNPIIYHWKGGWGPYITQLIYMNGFVLKQFIKS